MIYLDNAATTKPSQEYVKYYCDALDTKYYNASASYKCGIDCAMELDRAKKDICDFLNLPYNNNIIFTGSATEANNIAILGSIRKNTKHIVVSEGEHPSVYNVAKELYNQGYNVDFVPLQKNGQIDYDKLEKILKPETGLISCMLVSNETGAINDLKKIISLKNKICPNAIIHSDIVQGFGKIPQCKKLQNIDIITLSSHKIYGNKGLGALYAKNIKLLKPIIYGGGQEYNIRSGTQNTPAIFAFAKYVKNHIDLEENFNKVSTLREIFLSKFKNDNNIILNSFDEVSPYILSIIFKGVRGETLLNKCYDKGLIIGTGSACSSKKSGNRILQSMGINNSDILHSVRISFSKDNTIEEINKASEILYNCYYELREKLGVK